MKITTADEMREIDRITTARFGVQSIALMENAGSAVAQFILERYRHANRIAVICGKGNNGGMFERLPLRPIVLRNAQELQAESSHSLANCDLLVDAATGSHRQQARARAHHRA